jgi:hypothetical protein
MIHEDDREGGTNTTRPSIGDGNIAVQAETLSALPH